MNKPFNLALIFVTGFCLLNGSVSCSNLMSPSITGRGAKDWQTIHDTVRVGATKQRVEEVLNGSQLEYNYHKTARTFIVMVRDVKASSIVFEDVQIHIEMDKLNRVAAVWERKFYTGP